MIEHGHVNVKYMYYGLKFYLSDANHLMKPFAKLLRDLGKPPMSPSHVLFESYKTTPLYEAILDGNEVYLTSLVKSPQQLVLGCSW